MHLQQYYSGERTEIPAVSLFWCKVAERPELDFGRLGG